jgi:hypothetical protein
MPVIAFVLGFALLSGAAIDYVRTPVGHKGVWFGDLFIPVGPQVPVAKSKQPSSPSASRPGHSHPSNTGGKASAGGPVAPGMARCWAYTQTGSTVAMVVSRARALGSSPCTGNSWVLHWKDLEPAPGVYNWTIVDAAINGSAAAGKPVFLRVLAGIYSPTWILSVAQTASIPATLYTPAGWLPAPWDRGFLTAWETFIAAYGARYDANRKIVLIETAGTGIYGESYLPGGLPLWQSVGYTQTAYIAAIQEIIRKYVAAFPRHYVGLNVSIGVVGANQNVMSPLVSWVARTYPRKVYVQQNGLSGTTVPGKQAVQAAPLFGLQMVGPTNQSRTGSLCAAFRAALVDRAAFVEVYNADATNPAFYSTLRYLMNGKPAGVC